MPLDNDRVPHTIDYIDRASDDNSDDTFYFGLGLRTLNLGFRFRSRLSCFKYLICLDVEGKNFSKSLSSLVNFTPYNVWNILISKIGQVINKIPGTFIII